MLKKIFRGLLCFFVILTAVFSAAVSVDAATVLKAVAVSYDSAKLSWTAKENADGYIIESYENGKWKIISVINDEKLNSYIVRGLKSGTDYYFRMKYYIIKSGNKQYYYHGGAIRCTTALSKVTGFSATAGKKYVMLLWNSAENCDGYEFQRFNGTKWTELTELNSPEKNKLKINNPKYGKEYDVRVRAYKKTSSGIIYSQFSYLTFTATDKQSLTIFGPNTVYIGESFNYTYCLEGNEKGEVKWSVIGSNGEITEDGLFTALKKGDTAVVAKDTKGNVYAVLNVHCVDSSDNVISPTLVNGINIANKTYPVPKDYDPKGLTAEAEQAFEAMKKAALKDGIILRSISDYRSYEKQVTTYKYWKECYGEYADSISARPGFSEHQLGLAIDVNDMWTRFANTKEGKWLEENCYKYGFILRYPSYASEISTGYEYEPWHIRYLGKKLAKKVHFSGSTLEEYLGIDSYYR